MKEVLFVQKKAIFYLYRCSFAGGCEKIEIIHHITPPPCHAEGLLRNKPEASAQEPVMNGLGVETYPRCHAERQRSIRPRAGDE